jgi:hypothetical protein
MATSPLFVALPQSFAVSISTANTGRDGSGTLVLLVTGAASPGTRIDKIRAQAAGVTTAGVIRYFLDDGTTKRLIKERLVTAITPSASVAAFEDEWTIPDGIILPSASWSIKVSTNNAENFNVVASGGNF